MSRIGMQPITIPSGVDVSIEPGLIRVKGPKGELTRSLVNNMVQGVTNGYTRDLEIHGVGYRAALEGRTLVLNVGFSHQVRVNPPDGITFAVEGTNRVRVSGIDKQQVGEVAAQLRRIRPPEPYKGKGIRYAGEQIRRKAGKAGKVGK